MTLPSVHPGKVLKREMDSRDISPKILADELGIPKNRITEIIQGRRSLTPGTALRLACYFGNSANFWVNLQTNYDAAMAHQKLSAVVEREVERL